MKTATRRLVAAIAALFLISVFISCRTPQPAPGAEPPAEQATVEMLLQTATDIGDAFLQFEGTAYIKQEAPHLMPLLDTNKNDSIELAEVVSRDWSNPANLIRAWLVFSELKKAKKAKERRG